MKRMTIWAALATLLLAGCSSEEITERHDMSGENGRKTMSFSTYLPGHTRSYNATTATISNMTRENNVGFFLTAVAGNETLINGARFFVDAETSECTPADGTVYTWPGEDSFVQFMAHYPANTEMCTFDLSNWILNYTPDGKTDILAADQFIKATDQDGNVPLWFKHVLAYVKLNVACSNDVSNASFTLKGLTLETPKTGKYDFNIFTTMVSEGQTTYSFITKADEYVVLTTESKPIDSVMVVQTSDAKLTVNYSVTIGSSTKNYSKEASLNLEEGHLHQINIILKCDKPLTITTNVLPWNDTEGQDIILSDNNSGSGNGDNSGQDANGHRYIDLGLPSGTLWAAWNIGAESPENYGDYFAWGEVDPKDNYDWSTYSYCDGTQDVMTKYNASDGYTTLLSLDDVATDKWGGEWRMPTLAEWEELCENTTFVWTAENGVFGQLFTSKENGNTLFLPAAGVYFDNLEYSGSNGVYWSSSLRTSAPDDAWIMGFDSENVSTNDGDYGRSSGLSVRAVRSN